tara:strand:+ start:969 stop:2015 length:1047 start_codon:yes stop_codon:yes gene_type:complete
MAISTFKYCDISDVQQVYTKIADMDDKRPIYNWTATGVTNQYKSANSGLVSQLFVDGAELGSAESGTGAVTSDDKWYYDADTDTVYYFNDGFNPSDKLMEAGIDYTTYITDQIERASQQLNSMLDQSRFPIPIPKAFQYSADPANDTPEYDYVIVRLTALLTAYNCITAINPQSEEAEAIFRQITFANSGLLDKLNAGTIALNFETNTRDINGGNPIEITRNGTMYLVEAYCDGWTGAKFDRVQIICTTAGVYGTAKVSFKTLDGTNLYGNVAENLSVTGGLDYMGGNLYVRFEGNSMNVGDRWDIEMRNVNVETTNKNVKSINAHRGSKYANSIYKNYSTARKIRGS